MKLGEVVVHIDRVLQLHQVSLHSDEIMILLYQTHLTDGQSIRGRWIGPKRIA